MNARKLLDRLGAATVGGEANLGMKRDELEQVLIRLGEQESSLAERLSAETAPDQVARLTREIALVQAQRRKGREILARLP